MTEILYVHWLQIEYATQKWTPNPARKAAKVAGLKIVKKREKILREAKHAEKMSRSKDKNKLNSLNENAHAGEKWYETVQIQP